MLIILALSFAALVFAANALMAGDNIGWFLGFIGLIAMTLSIYLLTQNKRTVQMKIETPKVMTTIDCGKCGKTTREYQRGDFVFKDLGACQKCGDRQVITAIYKEVKEKEKTYNV